MACVSIGLGVPSGIFIPSLMSGAALGRLVGHLLHHIDSSSEALFADSGTYALVGAASGLACISRISISATVKAHHSVPRLRVQFFKFVV